MRKSFLVLAFFWFFLLLAWGVFHFFLSDGLSANPQHVRGSDNVAVSGYHNGNGNFVLWSSGRITSLKGEILNLKLVYNDILHAYSSSYTSFARLKTAHAKGQPQ